MKGYKGSDSRLANCFKNSRDLWRTNSATKQKKIRGLEVIRVRDLELSRDKWKQQAREAKQEIKRLKSQKTNDTCHSKEYIEGEYLPKEESSMPIKPRNHCYNSDTWGKFRYDKVDR